jgi:hypothetical protein
MVRTLLLAVAVAVTAASVVVATSGTAATSDPLALHGRSPRSVAMNVSIATGGLVGASGVVWLNAATNAFAAKLEVPLLTSSTEFDVRAINGVIYLTSPNLANATGPVWYTLRATWPSLAHYAHYLLKPNPALLSLLANARITHHGGASTYEITRSHVSLGTLGARRTGGGARGKLDVRVTTGPQGEFTGLRAVLTTSTATTTVSFNVVSFNLAHTITAPPPARAATSAAPLLQQLFTSGALGSFVLPTSWLQLLGRAKL